MINAFYSTENIPLANSLKRYFVYSLSDHLIDVHSLKNNKRENDNLFILENEKDINAIVDILQTYKTRKVTVLGYKNNIHKPCYINLINTVNLKINFRNILVSEEGGEDLSCLINIEVFKNKVRLFFEGHGETSLFDKLNDVRYKLLNGIKLFVAKEIDFEESTNVFLKSGIESWENFKRKFNNNTILIDLLGFHKETQEIQSIIESFEVYVLKINSFINTGSLSFADNTYSEYITLLKRIDDVLSKISNQLELTDVGI